MIDRAGGVLLDTLVKPTLPIPPDATAIHGITDAAVATAPTFDQVAPDLLRAIEGKLLVIYNADFDMRMLRQSAHMSGTNTNWLNQPTQCAMEQYAAYVGSWSRHHGSYRYQKLPGGDHSALGDARATLKVIKHMAGKEAQ